jgi:hypothetical protein
MTTEQSTLGRFTMGLPIPSMNDLQKRLAVQFVGLEEISNSREVHDYAVDVWNCCKTIANVIDAAGLPVDEDGCFIHPYDRDDKNTKNDYERQMKPFRAIEEWCLQEAVGCGSSGILGVAYLARLMSIDLNLRDVARGTLDADRTMLFQDLVNAALPPELPGRFWRMFASYRQAIDSEMSRQGLPK